MVFVSGRLFVSTNQDVSEMVLREAEVSEYDSPYIGIIESAVSRTKEPSVELQSNFGCIGSEIIFNGNGIAVNLNGQWIQFVPKEPADLNSIIQSEQAVYEEDVAAFIKNVLADNITVDIVEYITDTSKERIKELKITEEDMPDGCYIFNSDEEVTIWKCNAETVYTFIDWNGDFTGAEPPEEYTTTDIEEFQKNNFDTWIFFKWIFKTFAVVLVLSNTFHIVMAVFDVSQHVVQQSAGLIQGSTAVTPEALDNGVLTKILL